MTIDLDKLDWEKGQGLLPAVVQDDQTGQVLMLAYMNREALRKTLDTGRVTFWSRSRSTLWTKGESSGNFLDFKSVAADCDGDSLLVKAIPQGPTCHRKTVSCFAARSEDFGFAFLGRLEQLICKRKLELPPDSYTTQLFQAGLTQITKKLGEEAVEVLVSAMQSRERSVSEAADLLYHLLVFLRERDIRLAKVVTELENRHR
jgi:phosphoribosyl-ATP pyrophosphohydrolase/phosphoribosyl-AMP cyclohydrolase